VTSKEDTVKVVHLSLVPVGTVKQAGDTGDRRSLVGVGLDTNSGVVADRKKVVDNFETVLARGVVGSSNCADLGELGSSIVYTVLVKLQLSIGAILTLEEAEDRVDTGGRNVDGEFILPDGELLDVFGKASHQPGTIAVHVVRLALVLVGRVDDWGLECADVIARGLSQVGAFLGHCDILTSRVGQAANCLIVADLDGGLRGSES
jgi:hypothetical protein